ncbi:hypothetical protein GCM10010222_80550 [Streptomyces tanashiensis]|uniref:hypothetical protein n=1 Tax=Streptomyces tanashiensis TaxID=67367 RepID=UPI00167BD60D|nr:hypothetical protein [Streptomyces tanashiensis]GGT26681.1 hypothetical protein GCM10010222_80550 [Streptomyces tanashiensis]
MTSISPLVEAVTIFSLIAAGLCLIVGTVMGFLEHNSSKSSSNGRPAPDTNPVKEHAGADFAALGKMAEGMAKLRLSAQLLIVGLGFAAVAAAAAGIGSIATAIA